MSPGPLFLYGTLRHPPILQRVAGAPLEIVPARLAGHRVVAQADNALPFLQAAAGAAAPGILVRPDPEARARLDAYELPFGYTLAPVTVTTADGAVDAQAYFPGAGLAGSDRPWSLPDWVAGHAALALAVAEEFDRSMALNGPDADLGNWPMMLGRGAAQLRAAAQAVPQTRRHPARPGDVAVERVTALAGVFFRLSGQIVRHRRFDGGQNTGLTREVFHGVDAALVLPWDPASGLVLLVEQMRMGPFARGAANPWTLEPVAGIIDGTEEPAEAARREAWEEAHLESLDLRAMFSFYPSPGASTDHFYCFAGITDLTDHDRSHGGLPEEAEDLRLHVLPLAQALTLIETGEINAGPLIAMLYWLDRNRPAA